MYIIAIGDIAPAGHDYSNIMESGDNPLLALKKLISAQDIAVASLETPLTDRPCIFKNKCCLSASARLASVLRETGISVVSLANNHIMDCGVHGLEDTLKVLKENNIKYVGAGENIDEAMSPLLIENCGEKIAFIAANDVWVASSPFYASCTSPGVSPFDTVRIFQLVRDCKSKGYFVVLCIHWGLELYSYPSVNQLRLAHRAAEEGVDFLIGNHAHKIQPIETYNGSVILYCQGNVLFPNPFRWSMITPSGSISESLDYLTSEKRKSVLVKCPLGSSASSIKVYHLFLEDNLRIALNESEGLTPKWPRFLRFLWPFLWPFYSAYMEFKLRIFPFIQKGRDWRKLKKKLTASNFKEFIGLVSRCTKIIRGKKDTPYD